MIGESDLQRLLVKLDAPVNVAKELSLEEALPLILIDVHSLAVNRPLFSLAGTFKD